MKSKSFIWSLSIHTASRADNLRFIQLELLTFQQSKWNMKVPISIWKNLLFYIFKYDQCVNTGTLQQPQRGSCCRKTPLRCPYLGTDLPLQGSHLIQSFKIKPYKQNKIFKFLWWLLCRTFFYVCQAYMQLLGISSLPWIETQADSL